MSIQGYHAEAIAERQPTATNNGHCRACGKDNPKAVAAITDCCGAGPCYGGLMRYTDLALRSVAACCLYFAKDYFRCMYGEDPTPGFYATDLEN